MAATTSISQIRGSSSDGVGRRVAPEPSDADFVLDWEALAPPGLYYRRGKRLASLVLAAIVLPVVLVLGAVIAAVNLTIFRDPRRILFSQPRRGHRGTVFTLYKFRTMREVPTHAGSGSGAFASWSSGGDGLRVTHFGRLLRQTHLDELPQILNVLRGEMCFIGPRPEMLEVEAWARQHIPGFARRAALMPGITGWAQITQGYTTQEVGAYRSKLAADEFYRRNLSPMLDAWVLVRTAFWMLLARGWLRHIPRTESARPALLPSEPCAARNPEPARVPTRAGQPGREFSILGVDDQKPNRFVAGRLLRSGGHDVKPATSGAEASERLKAQPASP